MKPPPIPPPTEHVIKELCCLLQMPDGREISMPPPQPLESNAPRGYCTDDEDCALNSMASRVIARRAARGSRRAAGFGMLPDRMAPIINQDMLPIDVIAARVTRAYFDYRENLRTFYLLTCPGPSGLCRRTPSPRRPRFPVLHRRSGIVIRFEPAGVNTRLQAILMYKGVKQKMSDIARRWKKDCRTWLWKGKSRMYTAMAYKTKYSKQVLIENRGSRH